MIGVMSAPVADFLELPHRTSRIPDSIFAARPPKPELLFTDFAFLHS
jgi:hypothetical protein